LAAIQRQCRHRCLSSPENPCRFAYSRDIAAPRGLTGFIARARDPFLFEHSRTGDFTYNVPLKPGFYELHLFFSTPTRAGEGISTFSVSVNRENILQGFDINADALGENIADDRVFRGLSPGADGLLQIIFSGETGPPTLNALEILPGLPRTQLPIRLIMQTTPLTDRKGQVWYPDNFFLNGHSSSQAHPLMNSSDPDLFSRERFGHFTYAIPVDTWGFRQQFSCKLKVRAEIVIPIEARPQNGGVHYAQADHGALRSGGSWGKSIDRCNCFGSDQGRSLMAYSVFSFTAARHNVALLN
jgi:hypothetical protein